MQRKCWAAAWPARTFSYLELRIYKGALAVLGEMDCWKLKQESLDWQQRVCVTRQNGKWSKKKRERENAESPWPPARNLQSADGEPRDEEVHSIHF